MFIDFQPPPDDFQAAQSRPLIACQFIIPESTPEEGDAEDGEETIEARIPQPISPYYNFRPRPTAPVRFGPSPNRPGSSPNGVTTLALGEEGGIVPNNPQARPPVYPPPATTMALGEEGGIMPSAPQGRP